MESEKGREARLSDGEWKLMDLMWDKEPRTIGEMVDALKDDTGWNKSTIFMMLKRMLEKRIVRVDEGARCKQYYPVLRREEASNRETESFLSKVYRGSVGMMISSMAGQQKLSEKDIEELYEILQKARENEVRQDGVKEKRHCERRQS